MNRPFYYDLFYYVLFQGIPILTGLFILPLYSSRLSTEEYGQYSIIMATINVLAILSINWINVSTIRFYSEFETEEEKGQLMTIASLTLTVTTILGGIVLWIMGQLQLIVLDPLGLVIFMFFIMNIEHLITAYLKASRQVKLNTAIRTFYTILRFIVLATLLLAFEFGKEAIFYGNIAAAGATIILGGYWGGVKQRRIGREDLAKIKEYLGYGIPFIWILGVHWILTISDRYMLEFMKGSSEVGIYSLNYSLVQKIIMPIITIFMSTAAPIIFQLNKESNPVEAQKMLDRIFKYFLLLTVPSVIGLSLVSNEIGAVFIKNEFQEGFVIIPIIAVALFFLGVRQYTNIALEVEKKSTEIARVALIAGVTNVLFNLLLIRRWSYVGASYATLISYFVYFLLSYWKTKDLSSIRITVKKEFILILVSAGMMIPVLVSLTRFFDYPNEIMLVIKLVAGIALYGGLLFAFRLISIKELKDFLKKRKKGKNNEQRK